MEQPSPSTAARADTFKPAKAPADSGRLIWHSLDPNQTMPSDKQTSESPQEVADAIHLVCEDCGAVDHSEGLLAQLGLHLAENHGFEARSAEVTVFGLCVHCRQG